MIDPFSWSFEQAVSIQEEYEGMPHEQQELQYGDCDPFFYWELANDVLANREKIVAGDRALLLQASQRMHRLTRRSANALDTRLDSSELNRISNALQYQPVANWDQLLGPLHPPGTSVEARWRLKTVGRATYLAVRKQLDAETSISDELFEAAGAAQKPPVSGPTARRYYYHYLKLEREHAILEKEVQAEYEPGGRYHFKKTTKD